MELSGFPRIGRGMRVTTVETEAPTEVRSFPLTTLIAMVVGSMAGAGGFFLPRNFAVAAGGFGALITWVIAGTGMLVLANRRCFRVRAKSPQQF
jgi:hypothetical protein